MLSQELPPDLVWSLRALCQPYASQVELYPSGVCLGDELAEDFADAYYRFCELNPGSVPSDLKALEQLMLSKSGVVEHWEDPALRSGDFWEEIRACAKKCLMSRGLTTFAPHRSEKTYVFGP